MKKQLSATMAVTLGGAIEHGGRLERHGGGFWAWPGAPRDHRGIPIDYAGTTTVEALVARGEMEYVEWKEGRGGRFPIVASVTTKATEGTTP